MHAKKRVPKARVENTVMIGRAIRKHVAEHGHITEYDRVRIIERNK